MPNMIEMLRKYLPLIGVFILLGSLLTLMSIDFKSKAYDPLADPSHPIGCHHVGGKIINGNCVVFMGDSAHTDLADTMNKQE